MDGGDLKKSVFNKGKQIANAAVPPSAAATPNGGKKRRKGTDLKPIVTNEATAIVETTNTERCVPSRSRSLINTY